MILRADRSWVPAEGGTRYVWVRWPRSSLVPTETVLMLDWSSSSQGYREEVMAAARQLMSQSRTRLMAFADEIRVLADLDELSGWRPRGPQGAAADPWDPLQHAWLRACHAIAPDQIGPFHGHCILVTDGRACGETQPARLGRQAAEVWEHTGIATSVVAVGERPDEPLLRGLARRGGGHYQRLGPGEVVRLPPWQPRQCLEWRGPPGVKVELLSRSRGGRPPVVSGLHRLALVVRFRPHDPPAVLELGVGGEWERLTFGSEASPDGPDPEVMGAVQRAVRLRSKHRRPRPSPRRTAEGAAELVGRFVPATAAWPAPLPAIDLHLWRDLVRGCTLWGAVGSALGRPVIGMEPATIRRRFGPAGLRDYEPWSADRPDSRGTFSGDVQIWREVALTLLESPAGFDPEALARRLVRLLGEDRGLGQACEKAGAALQSGLPWWRAGVDSAGNGAALRAGPVGLVWALSEKRLSLHREAVTSALVTHTHPVGVAGAIVVAQAVAWLARRRLLGASLEAGELLHFLADAVEGLEPMAQRRLGAPAISLSQRLREVEELLRLEPEAALLVTWNGAFALESVPASLYCFLKFPDHPRQALLTAVNAGQDADSVGCMTGQFAGAWRGLRDLEGSGWWQGLEARDALLILADRLAEAALTRR